MFLKNKNCLVFLSLLFLIPGSLFLISEKKHSSLFYLINAAQQKYNSQKSIPFEDTFKFTVGHIPLAQIQFRIEDGLFKEKEALKLTLTLVPPKFLSLISGNRIGLETFSFVDPKTFLPFYFEQTDLYRKKRGKKGRAIEYNHKQRIIFRRGQYDDIEEDTRDYVSLIGWLMSRNYEEKSFITSTININRNIFLVVGQAKKLTLDKDKEHLETAVELNVRCLGLTKEIKIKNSMSFHIFLIREGRYYLPLRIEFKIGIIPCVITLKI